APRGWPGGPRPSAPLAPPRVGRKSGSCDLVVLEHRTAAAPLADAHEQRARQPFMRSLRHFETGRHAAVGFVGPHGLSRLDAREHFGRGPGDALVVDVNGRAVAGLELVVGLELHQSARPEARPVAARAGEDATGEPRALDLAALHGDEAAPAGTVCRREAQ